MKILICDDQPIVLKSIEYVLQSAGFNTKTVKDGSEALLQVDAFSPDLIILDLNMPVVSGFEVLKKLKTEDSLKIPIIVLSGINDEETIVNAFSNGADDYIQKPVGLSEIVVRVKRLLKMPLNVEVLKKKGNASVVVQKNGVGVVVPCYNEENRLKTEEFALFVAYNPGYHICFVNDGSTDGTLEVLNSFTKGKEDFIEVYDCKQNGGKAEAVRQGILHLSQNKSLDYIGFLDADLSTNFQDFDDLVKTISEDKYKIVSGSRINRMGANIVKQSSRGIISKTINFIIRKILKMEFQDTQCGAKVMTRDIIDATFQEPFLTKWLFDVEIFLRMRNHFGLEKAKELICEQPLRRWVHEDGSKLSMKDSIKIIGQLARIGLHYPKS